jgi:hypothetical protein
MITVVPACFQAVISTPVVRSRSTLSRVRNEPSGPVAVLTGPASTLPLRTSRTISTATRSGKSFPVTSTPSQAGVVSSRCSALSRQHGGERGQREHGERQRSPHGVVPFRQSRAAFT